MKYIFKTKFPSLSIGEYYDEELMANVNDGWEVCHAEKGMIIFRKEVSEEEYKEYSKAIGEKVDRMNNCPYLD